MAQATDYYEGISLSALATLGSVDLATGNVTAGSGGYIGLLTAAPSDSTGGTEVSTSGTAYARNQVGSSGQGNLSGTAGSITNDAEFKWNDATADWGQITHVGLYDAATGGNLLVYGELQTAVDITAGDIFKIPAGGFTITMA